jgi:hypothetical protein
MAAPALALALAACAAGRPRRAVRAPVATARGEYLPGEAAYSSLARRRPQRCGWKAAPTVAVLVLFGKNEARLRASIRRTAGLGKVLHASGECTASAPPAWWRGACAGGECACLRCCRGFGGANNSRVRREMVDRLAAGFRAVLARFPDVDYVLKAEDDTTVDGQALAALLARRPLCDGTVYGNCHQFAHERRPYCHGGSGYLLDARVLLPRLLARTMPAGPEDVAFAAHVLDAGGRLANACGLNPACHRGADARLPPGPPPACARFGAATRHRCS